MGALLNDASMIDDENPVGAAEGAHAMPDDERRAASHGVLQRVEHLVLGFGIDGGRGVVEDQNRRIEQNGARDGEALPLPARQI